MVGVRCAVADLLRGREAARVRVEVAAEETPPTPGVLRQEVSTADADSDGCITLRLTRAPTPAVVAPRHGPGSPATRCGARRGAEHGHLGFPHWWRPTPRCEHRGLALTINRIVLFVRGAVWTVPTRTRPAASPAAASRGPRAAAGRGHHRWSDPGNRL
ncbi:hypothetical protein QJS66_11375 [Kocuria rhizophila]|nr:hypothetical protein QJS66_11375 [Kocuria rhizophila]